MIPDASKKCGFTGVKRLQINSGLVHASGNEGNGCSMFKVWRALYQKGPYLFTSMVILVFLLVQAGESFVILCRWKCAPWPFMNYPMYREAYTVGDQVNQYVVFASFADLTEAEIHFTELNLDSWFKFRNFIDAIRRRDLAKIRPLLAVYQQHKGKVVIGLRLEDQPLLLTAAGLMAQPTRQLQLSIPTQEEK